MVMIIGCRLQMGPPALSISTEWITLILILHLFLTSKILC